MQQSKRYSLFYCDEICFFVNELQALINPDEPFIFQDKIKSINSFNKLAPIIENKITTSTDSTANSNAKDFLSRKIMSYINAYKIKQKTKINENILSWLDELKSGLDKNKISLFNVDNDDANLDNKNDNLLVNPPPVHKKNRICSIQ